MRKRAAIVILKIIMMKIMIRIEMRLRIICNGYKFRIIINVLKTIMT